MKIPHSIEAEQRAVGCAVLDPKYVGELNPEWFHDLRLRAIAIILQGMQDEGRHIDDVSVQLRIRALGKELEIGIPINDLTNGVWAPSGFHEWAAILNEKMMLRDMHKLCCDFARDSASDSADAHALVEEFERKALEIRPRKSGQTVDIKAECDAIVSDFEHAWANQGSLRGLPTGFHVLDGITNGLRPGQMVVIAARPSVGKTSLAMNMAESMAVDRKEPIAVFSLEMSARELLTRMICSRAEVPSDIAETGAFRERDFPKMSYSVSTLCAGKLHLCEASELAIGQIRAIARKLKHDHGIKAVIVDYLQLVSSGAKRAENQHAEITIVSHGLKAMAKELGLPVIALAQLNRDVEKRDTKPKLSDLRGSGSIEQDADLVCLLFRESNEGLEVPIDLIIAKNRNGRTGVVPLMFDKQFTRFKPRPRETHIEGGI